MATLDQLESALRNADAAGDASAAQMLAGEIVKMRSAAPSNPDGMAADVAKSTGIGLARGAIGMAGTPGDMGSMLGAAVDWGANKLGISPETVGSVKNAARAAAPYTPFIGAMVGPGSADITRGVESLTGEFYKPQTVAGEYARTVGEFAPAALMGPASLARRAVTQVAIPALGSETAGQLTKGTELEPYARVVGGVGGAALANIGNAAKSMTKEAAKSAPTAEGLKQQTDALYGQLRNAGVQYDTSAFGQTVANMRAALPGRGKLPSAVSEAHSFVDDLERAALPQKGKPAAVQSLDFDDVNEIRKVAGEMAREAGRGGRESLARAFNIIVDKLDDFERNAPLIGNPSLNQTQLNALRDEARKTALQNIKQRTFADIVEKAETYQGGFESGIRNQVSNLLRSNKGMQLFDGAERAALLEVAKGRKPLQTLSRFGFDLTSLSGNASFLPTLGAIGAGFAGGPLIGGALAAAGTAAKFASPLLTQRSLDQAVAAIRSGKLAGPQAAAKLQQLKSADVLRKLRAGGLAGLLASDH